MEWCNRNLRNIESVAVFVLHHATGDRFRDYRNPLPYYTFLANSCHLIRMMGLVEKAEKFAFLCLYWARHDIVTATTDIINEAQPTLVNHHQHSRGVALIHHSVAKAFAAAHHEKEVSIAHAVHALKLQINAAESNANNASVKNELAETILFICSYFMTLPRPELSDFDNVLEKTYIPCIWRRGSSWKNSCDGGSDEVLSDLVKQLFSQDLTPRTIAEMLFHCWRLSTNSLTLADCLAAYARLRIACKDTGDVQPYLAHAHSIFNRQDDVYGQAECYRLMSSAKWKNAFKIQVNNDPLQNNNNNNNNNNNEGSNLIIDVAQADPREISLSLLLLDRAARMFEQCGKTEYASKCRLTLSKHHALVMQNEGLRTRCFQRFVPT